MFVTNVNDSHFHDNRVCWNHNLSLQQGDIAMPNAQRDRVSDRAGDEGMTNVRPVERLENRSFYKLRWPS